VGSWGFGVEQDDFVRDVLGEFDDRLKRGATIDSATQAVLVQFADAVDDPDDGPLLWLGLARAQWRYGEASADILAKVRADLAAEAGLERWADEGPAVLAKRRERLARFVAEIERPNPKPRPFPKLVVRKPIFEAGDCLAVRLNDGRFGAALVLVADHSRPEYGKNLIGVLNYLGDTMPDETVFRRREWLILTHHNWHGEAEICWYDALGFKAHKQRFSVVARIEVDESDPTDGASYGGWGQLGEQVILQREWDAQAG
jgi:hypothetical protein